MKHLYFLLLVIGAFAHRSDAQATSSCVSSPALQKAYYSDAADMALQRIYQLRSPDTILIDIPQRYQDTVMEALAAVCNLGSVYESDSVFQHYCVHRYVKYMPKIMVKVDPGISWVVNWRALSIKTGDLAIDELLQRYGIFISSYWYDPNNSELLRDWAYLSSDHHINWKALGDSLSRCRGIWGYSKAGQYGDGDRIYYTKDSVARLTFIAGRGDCPAGCTEYKKWTYSIAADCSVQVDTIVYSLERDFYMPHCNLAPLSILPDKIRPKALLQLFPNPAQSKLYLKDAQTASVRFTIYNVVGKKILSGKYEAGGIDVSGLPNGFYVLTVQDGSHSYSAAANFTKR